MASTTLSTKRNRVYERAFDHDEAKALRAQGLSYPKIADRLGVSTTAVARVCNPRIRERMNENVRQWGRDNCRVPCKGGCGRLVWAVGEGGRRHRTGYCPECWGHVRCAKDVLDDGLRCLRCGEWKPDDEFGREKRKTRRGRSAYCRACETKARRENRAKNRQRERTNDLARYYNKKRGGVMPEYVVLKRQKSQDPNLWAEVGRATEPSAPRAIEAVATSEGTYIAVSAGQFKGRQVRKAQAFKVS